MGKSGVVVWVILVAAAVPAEAQTLYATDASLEAPVRLYPVGRTEAPEKSLADGPQELTLTFWLENTTGQTVEDVFVTAYVFSDQGLPRGFYSYLVQDSIAPLQATYFHYTTGEFKVHTGDRVIPVVEEARRGAETWRLEEIWTGDAILSSSYYAGDVYAVPQKAVDICEAKCEARETKCTESCSHCEEFIFGCTCGSDGTISSTCHCKTCRPRV